MIKHKNGFKRDDQFTLHCDCCSKHTLKTGFATPGDAADQARKEGFITKCVNLTAPASWHCPDCKDKAPARSVQISLD